MTKTATRPETRPKPEIVHVDRRPVHLRAKRNMILVCAVCAAVGMSPGLEQLAVHGRRAFVTRPAGVGASEDAPDAQPAALPPVPAVVAPPIRPAPSQVRPFVR